MVPEETYNSKFSDLEVYASSVNVWILAYVIHIFWFYPFFSYDLAVYESFAEDGGEVGGVLAYQLWY